MVQVWRSAGPQGLIVNPALVQELDGGVAANFRGGGRARATRRAEGRPVVRGRFSRARRRPQPERVRVPLPPPPPSRTRSDARRPPKLPSTPRLPEPPSPPPSRDNGEPGRPRPRAPNQERPARPRCRRRWAPDAGSGVAPPPELTSRLGRAPGMGLRGTRTSACPGRASESERTCASSGSTNRGCVSRGSSSSG